MKRFWSHIILTQLDKSFKIHTLLIHGADPNKQTVSGNTSLHLAVIHNFPKCIPLLLLYGANAYIKNRSNNTPLDLAISKSNIELTALLLNCSINEVRISSFWSNILVADILIVKMFQRVVKVNAIQIVIND